MRSDKEDKAQQSTVDDPTAARRSPLKETPASQQRLRQAIAEEVGERRISAAVGRLRNMQVCDHGPTPHVASERRQRQVQEFEEFCANKGAQAQCCQYDCARHEECHGALAIIHGGVLRCLVTKNILVQHTTTPKQPPLERSLEDLIHKQARRRFWYGTLTGINQLAAKEIQRQMEQAQAEITLHQQQQSKKSVGFYGFDEEKEDEQEAPDERTRTQEAPDESTGASDMQHESTHVQEAPDERTRAQDTPHGSTPVRGAPDESTNTKDLPQFHAVHTVRRRHYHSKGRGRERQPPQG